MQELVQTITPQKIDTLLERKEVVSPLLLQIFAKQFDEFKDFKFGGNLSHKEYFDFIKRISTSKELVEGLSPSLMSKIIIHAKDYKIEEAEQKNDSLSQSMEALAVKHNITTSELKVASSNKDLSNKENKNVAQKPKDEID